MRPLSKKVSKVSKVPHNRNLRGEALLVYQFERFEGLTNFCVPFLRKIPFFCGNFVAQALQNLCRRGVTTALLCVAPLWATTLWASWVTLVIQKQKGV